MAVERGGSVYWGRRVIGYLQATNIHSSASPGRNQGAS
jgi:hypothetical protein